MEDIHYYQLAALVCDRLENQLTPEKDTPFLQINHLTFLNPGEAPLFGTEEIEEVYLKLQQSGADIIKYGDQWMLKKPFNEIRFNQVTTDVFGNMFDLLMITLDDPSQIEVEQFHTFTIENSNEVILQENYITQLIQQHRELLV